MRRLAVVVGIVIAISILVILQQSQRPVKHSDDTPYLPPPAQDSPPEEEIGAVPPGEGEVYKVEEPIIGSKDAKLKIQVCAPLGCHKETVDILTKIAKSNPDKIRLELLGMNTPEGQKILDEHNMHCAAIFFNGVISFKIKEDGREREVAFTQAEGGRYTIDDIIPVVRQQLEKLYGPNEVPDPLIVEAKIKSNAKSKEKGASPSQSKR